MSLSTNTKDRLKSLFIFIYTGFKVMIATLLSIFVTQSCPLPNGNSEECSLYDNFTNLTRFNEGVIIFNFLTLGVFIGFYILEFYRENVCIKYLDIDENLPNNNLRIEIVQYPKIEKKLLTLNNHYHRYSIVLIFINIVNIVLSSILLSQFYDGFKTVTGLITNIFLIAGKIYTALRISHKSVSELFPYSAYMDEYIIFNTIDPDYKQRKIMKKQNINVC
jgi:hypothetical protein